MDDNAWRTTDPRPCSMSQFLPEQCSPRHYVTHTRWMQPLTLSSESTIQDVNGNSAPAMRIFAMAIRYLKNEVARELNLQNNDIDEKNFKYVITVPAIWDDAAKQFMREAAKEAGIASERLQLALEPEVASIWCQTDSLDSIIALAGPGTRYMIVDLGGGSLKEIHKSSGGPWGGMYVDENYIAFIRKIFGE
ncbi:HS12B-like protein [Mya arenaria]|uniref:HS12B-like protein n=1 Tax=Mya arenaria TaxID=6604 RepID=A0ABY7GAF1_MYAAR|nr:HS12B-like protein [Mya arenaria]